MSQDPGWRRPLAALPRALIPGGAKALTGGGLSPLDQLRLVYLAFVSALAVLYLMLWLLGLEGAGSMGQSTAVVILVAVAFGSYVAVLIVRNRGQTVASAAEAVSRYRIRMFTIFALAEPVALVGFALSFLTQSPATYLVGLALAAPGLYMAAPTRSSVDGFQEQLGGMVDVASALLTAEPTPEEPAPRD